MAQEDSEAVLIIDEDHLARRLAGSILTARNYEVLEAWEWKGAKALLQGRFVRLAIVDVRMELASRGRLTGRLRKYHPNLQVILTYCPRDEQAIQSYTVAPGATCLPKPFAPAELRRAVRSALERPARRALSNVA